MAEDELRPQDAIKARRRGLNGDDMALGEALLVWLAPGRFVRAATGDYFASIVMAFDRSREQAGLSRLPGNRMVTWEFLKWLYYDDRIKTIGPENPDGETVKFYHDDFRSDLDTATSEVTAARAMIAIYDLGD